VSDVELGHDIRVGIIFGTPFVFLAVVLMGIAAGIGANNAVFVAVVPGAFGGIFFGGIFPLSRQMARHERHERARLASRSSTGPAASASPTV